jgi:serine/threonine-protein kinase RsbT
MLTEARVPIRSAEDIVTARQKGRALAVALGFEATDITLIATAISEVTRNIVDHAEEGSLSVNAIHHGGKRGILIIAEDQGPGIRDVDQAMQYGFTTRRGLGVGLPGAKWLMDEFNIDSKPGEGTTVRMKKWLLT